VDGFPGAEDAGGAGWSAQAALDAVQWPDGARYWPWDRQLAWWTAAQPEGLPTVGQAVAVTAVLMGTADAQAREWLLDDWGPEVLVAGDGETIIQELRAWGLRLATEPDQHQQQRPGPDTPGQGQPGTNAAGWAQEQPGTGVWEQDRPDAAGWGQGQSDTGEWGQGVPVVVDAGVWERVALRAAVAPGVTFEAVVGWLAETTGSAGPAAVAALHRWGQERGAWSREQTVDALLEWGRFAAAAGGHAADTDERPAKRQRTHRRQGHEPQQDQGEDQGLGGCGGVGPSLAGLGARQQPDLAAVGQVSERTGVPAGNVEQWVWAAHPRQPTPQAAYHALQQDRGHDMQELTDRDWQLAAAAGGETRIVDITRKLGTTKSAVTGQLNALAGKLGLNATGVAVLPLLKNLVDTGRLRPTDRTWPAWPPPKPWIDGLTDREWQLVAAAAAGETSLAAIARKLGITPSALCEQLNALAGKLSLNATTPGTVLPRLKAEVAEKRLLPLDGAWPPPPPQAKPLTDREWQLVAAAAAGETDTNAVARQLGVAQSRVIDQLSTLAANQGLGGVGGEVLPLLKAEVAEKRLLPLDSTWPPPPPQAKPLTKRQRELVAAARAGETEIIAIAQLLGISQAAVRNQLTTLANRLGLKATGGAVLPLLEVEVAEERLVPAGGTWPAWPPTAPKTKPLTEREWQLVAAARAGETRPADIARKLLINQQGLNHRLNTLAGKLCLDARGAEVLPLVKAKAEAEDETERLVPPGGTWPAWPPTAPQAAPAANVPGTKPSSNCPHQPRSGLAGEAVGREAARSTVLRFLCRSSSKPGGRPPRDPLRRRAARLSVLLGMETFVAQVLVAGAVAVAL